MRAEKPDQEWNVGGNELLGRLRDVLRPEPLPANLVQRIRADWDVRGQRMRRRGFPTVHFAWLAAAACLMVAFVLPPQTPGPDNHRRPTVALTSDEAAEIVSAYVILSWDDPASYTLDAVDSSLRHIDSTLSDDNDGGSLPWGGNDAWDNPPTKNDGPVRSLAKPEKWCVAACDAGQTVWAFFRRLA